MFSNKHRKSFKFKAGENVRIKPKELIFSSLDSEEKLDGLLFTNQMAEYCGKSYKILRAGSSFFNEHQHRTYRPRSPFYILENLICEGRISNLPYRCDHSCFLMWHEDWLEKAK